MKKSIIAILVSTASLGFGASNAFAGLTLNVNQDGTFAEEGTWKEGGYNNGLRNPYCKDNAITGAGPDGCTQNHKNDDVVYWGEMQGIVSDIKTTGTFVNWNYDKVKEARADIVEINKKLDTATAVGKEVYDNRSLLLNKGEQVVNNQIDNSINNIINGGNTEINGVINSAKDTANDFDARITANKNRIDDQATRIGKVEDKAETNRKDIVSINKETKRLDNVKADKADLTDLDNKVDGAIADGTQAIANINGRINNAVDNAKTLGVKIGGIAIDKVPGIVDGIKGDVTNAIDNSVTNIVEGNNTEINNALDAKFESNNKKLEAKLNAEVDRGETAYNDLSGRIDAVIGDKNEDMTELRAQVAANLAETIRLEDVKADRAELDAAITNGTDAFNNLNGKVDNAIKVGGDRLTVVEGNVESNTNDINTINGKISKVENVGKTVAVKLPGAIDVAIDKGTDLVNNVQTNINNTIDGKIDGSISNIVNGGNTEINNALDAKISAKIGDINIGDIDLSNNADFGDLAQRVAKNEANIATGRDQGTAAYNDLNNRKADKSDITDAIADAKGNVIKGAIKVGNTINDNSDVIKATIGDKVTNVIEGDTNIGVAIDGKIDGKITNLREEGKTSLAVVNARLDQAEGDISELIVKGNTAKDQLGNDIKDVNDRIDNITGNVRTAAGKIVANKDIIINKGQEAVDKGITYVNNKISESIVNGDNVLANEINNQINAKFEKQGEDFTNRINAEVARGEAAADKGAEELANLNNSLAETNSYVDRQVVRGESAYRVVSTRVDNGYAVGEATRDDLQRQIDELDGKTLNEGDVTTIVNQAGKEVAIKVGKGLVDNSTNITEGAKNVINAEINKKVEAGKNLAIQKGKEVVTNVQAKLPAVQGEIVKKAGEAKTYVNNINAKADTALNMGYENAQNITTERNDRIQGQKDTLKAANNYTDNKFSALKNQVESNRRKAASGVAGVAAMTNIPALTGDASGSFGMGLGHYDGAQSISAGVQQRFNQNVIGKASFASDDHGNVVVGVGASVQW